MLNMKISKIAAVVEEQDQDKNYGPVGLTTGVSNLFVLWPTIVPINNAYPIFDWKAWLLPYTTIRSYLNSFGQMNLCQNLPSVCIC